MSSSEEKPNVIVIGAGGVGVIAALSLFHAQKTEVSLVVRSDYHHVTKEGYKISSCDYGELSNWKPHHLYKDVDHAIEEAPKRFYEYVIITTKNIPDGPMASRVPTILKPILENQLTQHPERKTNILLIQNGIDIECDVLETYDKSKYNYNLLSGIQIIGSTKIGKGIINQQGHEHLSVGSFNASDMDAIKAAQKFVGLYLNEGLNSIEFDERVRYSRWKKLIYNAAINTTTALVGLDVPRTLEFAKNKKSTELELYKPAMQEIVNIAAAEGIVLDEQFIEFFSNISRNMIFKPSMCVDVQKHQLMELEVILGNPLKLAEKYNVQTPVLRMLYNLLILVQCKLKEEKGLIKFDETTARLVDN